MSELLQATLSAVVRADMLLGDGHKAKAREVLDGIMDELEAAIAASPATPADADHAEDALRYDELHDVARRVLRFYGVDMDRFCGAMSDMDEVIQRHLREEQEET